MVNHYEDLDMRRYWVVIRRRKRIMLASVLACLLLAVTLNAVTVPVYRTSARIEIRQSPSRSPLTGEAIENPTAATENRALFTTAELITNRTLLERVAQALRARHIGLAPPRRPGLVSRILAGAGGPTSAAPAAPDSSLAMQRDVNWLLKTVSVRPVIDTRLVDIQAEHSDAHHAADIANIVASMFVEFEESRRHEADTTRLSYLKEQIADMRKVIQSSEQTLYGSREASLMLLEGRRKRLTESVADLNTAYIKAKTDRLAVESQLARARSFPIDSAGARNDLPVQTPALDELHRDLQRAETEVAQAREVYRDRHPKLVALESKCQSLRDGIRRELSKSISDIEGQHAVLLDRENDLARTIAEQEASLRALSDQVYKYSTLESELGTNRDLYSLLLKRSQEQGIAHTIEPALVQLVEPASVPLRRARPRKTLNLAIGFVLGLTVGFGLSLALEVMRRTIRTPRDVVRELQLPVIGMIPRRL
jgi:uncharacterized protein involved in exopolysaccharide biosynthesis